jgi:hypothetical protein
MAEQGEPVSEISGADFIQSFPSKTALCVGLLTRRQRDRQLH